ncbi:MAG: fibronectin type III domain-containing protein [Verrucomicrobiota bacterium]
MLALKFLLLTLFTVGIALTANARTGSSTGSVTLIWDPNPEPNISGYNVHFGSESGNYTSVLNAGSSPEMEIADLDLGETYYCAVTAYNTIGLESAFSAEIAVTFVDGAGESIDGRLILVEAEDGVINAPMVVQGAGDVSWVQDDTITQEGFTEISFESQINAPYQVWCRVKAPSSGSDSYFVSMDGGVDEVFHVYGDSSPPPLVYSDDWVWQRIETQSGQVRNFNLAPGPHTIRFRSREAAVQLDRIVLCTDPDFVPNDDLPRSGDVLAITGPPADQSTHVGGVATFNVIAAATGPIQYQWVKDGLAINGETGPSLRVSGADFDDAANYSVFIWSDTVIKTAGPAELIVHEFPFRVTSMSIGSNHLITFNLSGELGKDVSVFASSDLENWTLVDTETNHGGTITVDDPGAEGQPKRFYKLVTPDP